MRRVRIQRPKRRSERPWLEVLPLDPRGQGVVRAKKTPGCTSEAVTMSRRGREEGIMSQAGEAARRGGISKRGRDRTLLRFLLAMMGLVLTACAGVEDGAAVATSSGSVDRPTGTATVSPPPPEEPDCSAAASSGMLEPQDALPYPVVEVRVAVAEAAVACDYARLEALARAHGDRFTFSFGDANDPAAYWRQQEASGGEPLLFLVEILRRPYGEMRLAEEVLYVWPSAATYEGWAEVPPEARDALRPLYGGRDFALFEEFGAYTGYRVGITDSGEWIYFVAGD